MKDMELIQYYGAGIFTLVKGIFTKPIITLTALPTMGVLGYSTNIYIMLLILLISWTADFGSGMLASWVEYKEKLKKGIDENHPPYFIESSKIRNSIVKAVVYMLFIGLFMLFEMVFFKINITQLESFTNRQFTGTEIVIIICFLVEFWSILENSKRAGFDIVGKIKSMLSSLLSVKEKVTSLVSKEEYPEIEIQEEDEIN